MNSREPGAGHGLTKENLVATLPVALQKDPSVVALAEAIAELLARRPDEIERLRIYPAIDQLDGQLLDILAYDFKVDWWDADYSVEEKRQTLKDSWRVHKLLGTKAAVETAMSAVYPETKVEEWFEYGGEPYGFRILLDLTGTEWTEERPRRILERSEYYKSLRSHLDGLEYTRRAEKPAEVNFGGTVSAISTLPMPQAPDEMRWKHTLRVGSAAAMRSILPIPELT